MTKREARFFIAGLWIGIAISVLSQVFVNML